MSWLSSLESEKNLKKLIQLYQETIPSQKGNANPPNAVELATLIKRDLNKSSEELHGAILDCLLVLLVPSGYPRLKEEASPILGKAIIKLTLSEKPLRIKMLKCLHHLTFTDDFLQEHMVQMVSLLMDAIAPPSASLLKAAQFLNRLLKDHTEMMMTLARHWIIIFASLLVEDSEMVQKMGLIWLRQYLDQLVPQADDLGSILSLRDEYLQSRLLQMVVVPGKEIYALRVWGALILLFGKELHSNVALVNLFMQVVHQGFVSPKEEVYLEAMAGWDKLINNFATQPVVISSSRRLKLILNPLQKESKSEGVLRGKIFTWWHLVSSLGTKINGSSFELVVVPLLKISLKPRNSVTRSGQNQNKNLIRLHKRFGSEILCRLLQTNSRPTRVRSPKKQSLEIKSLKSAITPEILLQYKDIMLTSLGIAIDFLLESQSSVSLRQGSMHLLQYLLQVFMVRLGSLPATLDSHHEFVAAGLQLIHQKVPKFPPAVRAVVLDEVSMLPAKILADPLYDINGRSQSLGPCIHFLRLLLQEYTSKGCTEQSLEPFTTLVRASVSSSQRPLDLLCSILPVMGKDSGPLVWSSLTSTATECIQNVEVSLQVPGNLELLVYPFSTFLKPPIPVADNQLKVIMGNWGPLYEGLVQLAVSPNLVCHHVCSQLLELVTADDFKNSTVYITISTGVLTAIIGALDLSDPKNPSPEASLQSKAAIEQQLERTVPFIHFFGRTFGAFKTNLNQGQIMDGYSHMELWTERTEYLLPKFLGTSQALSFLRSIVPPVTQLASENWSHIHSSLLPKMEQLVSTLYREIECSTMKFSGELLAILSPLLEATLIHPRRSVVEKARTFWNATFTMLDSDSAVPSSLRECVKKMKDPILLCSPRTPQSATDGTPKPAQPVESTPKMAASKATSSSTPKTPSYKQNLYSFLTPTSSKKSKVDEGENFVVIKPRPTPSRRILTEHQKEKLKEKSHVPAMYNDLSQDTQDISQSNSLEDNNNSQTTQQLPPVVRSPEKIVSGVVDLEIALDESPLHQKNRDPVSHSPLNLHLSFSRDEQDMEVIPSSQEQSSHIHTSDILAEMANPPSVTIEAVVEAQSPLCDLNIITISSEDSPAVLVPESPPKDDMGISEPVTCPETEDFLPQKNDQPETSAAQNETQTTQSSAEPDNSPLPRNRRVKKAPTKLSFIPHARKSLPAQGPSVQSRKRKAITTPSSLTKKTKLKSPSSSDPEDDTPLIFLKPKASETQDVVMEEQENIPDVVESMENDLVNSEIILEPQETESSKENQELEEAPKEMAEEAGGKENQQPLELGEVSPEGNNSIIEVQAIPLRAKPSPEPTQSNLLVRRPNEGCLPAGLRRFPNLSRGQQMVISAISQLSRPSDATTISPQSSILHSYSPSASPSSSILKKRPDNSDETPKKQNRVSFSDPLVVSEHEIEPKERYEFRTPRRKPQLDVSRQPQSPTVPLRQVHSEQGMPSSRTPVFPELSTCKHPVDDLLSQLAFGSCRGLSQVLTSLKIRTIGDLASLDSSEVNQLPIVIPKLAGLLKVLKVHLSQSHETPSKHQDQVLEESLLMLTEVTPPATNKAPAIIPQEDAVGLEPETVAESCPQEAMEVDNANSLQEERHHVEPPLISENSISPKALDESIAEFSAEPSEQATECLLPPEPVILVSGSEEFIPAGVVNELAVPFEIPEEDEPARATAENVQPLPEASSTGPTDHAANDQIEKLPADPPQEDRKKSCIQKFYSVLQELQEIPPPTSEELARVLDLCKIIDSFPQEMLLHLPQPHRENLRQKLSHLITMLCIEPKSS